MSTVLKVVKPVRMNLEVYEVLKYLGFVDETEISLGEYYSVLGTGCYPANPVAISLYPESLELFKKYGWEFNDEG
ncbi:MAG: hypothetical protein F6K41_43415 [Symploca sp. SIO3E6]|nr:hypothetical protein [Caldora sp. SIO3E6]